MTRSAGYGVQLIRRDEPVDERQRCFALPPYLVTYQCTQLPGLSSCSHPHSSGLRLHQLNLLHLKSLHLSR